MCLLVASSLLYEFTPTRGSEPSHYVHLTAVKHSFQISSISRKEGIDTRKWLRWDQIGIPRMNVIYI